MTDLGEPIKQEGTPPSKSPLLDEAAQQRVLGIFAAAFASKGDQVAIDLCMSQLSESDRIYAEIYGRLVPAP